MKATSEIDSYKHIKRTINVIILIFSTVLLLDILLGVQASEEEIKYRTYEQQRTGSIRSSGTRTVIGIITNKNDYPVRNVSFYNDSRKGDKIFIFKTKILGEVTKIRNKNIEYLDPVYSIYSFYYLLPLICFTSSFYAFILDKFQSLYYDLFLVLSSVITFYLIISIFTRNII